MPIKEFTFSFKLSASDLMQFVAEKNVSVNIEAFGNGPVAKQVAASPVLALPAPGKQHIKKLLLLIMAQNPKAAYRISELSDAMAASGRVKKSASPQLSAMKKAGMVKNPRVGVWKITAKGLREVANGRTA